MDTFAQFVLYSLHFTKWQLKRWFWTWQPSTFTEDLKLDVKFQPLALIPSRGGHSSGGINGYVRLTGISFSAFYEQEGCTKMGISKHEGSLKWWSDEPMGPRVWSTDTLEPEGVNNLKHVALHCEQEGVCFSWTHEREGVGGLAVQPHIPVLFRT